jgi:hypothetical protein
MSVKGILKDFLPKNLHFLSHCNRLKFFGKGSGKPFLPKGFPEKTNIPVSLP